MGMTLKEYNTFGSGHTCTSTNVSCFELHFLANRMVLTTQTMAFNILILNDDGLVLVHHDSQKIKKTVKTCGDKVLDTHSPIQYITASLL